MIFKRLKILTIFLRHFYLTYRKTKKTGPRESDKEYLQIF